MLKKYTNTINGETTNLHNFEMLTEKMNHYVLTKCVGNRAAIVLDIPGSEKLMLNLNVEVRYCSTSY
jgi:hypothetical protein